MKAFKNFILLTSITCPICQAVCSWQKPELFERTQIFLPHVYRKDRICFFFRLWKRQTGDFFVYMKTVTYGIQRTKFSRKIPKVFRISVTSGRRVPLAGSPLFFQHCQLLPSHVCSFRLPIPKNLEVWRKSRKKWLWIRKAMCQLWDETWISRNLNLKYSVHTLGFGWRFIGQRLHFLCSRNWSALTENYCNSFPRSNFLHFLYFVTYVNQSPRLRACSVSFGHITCFDVKYTRFSWIKKNGKELYERKNDREELKLIVLCFESNYSSNYSIQETT